MKVVIIFLSPNNGSSSKFNLFFLSVLESFLKNSNVPSNYYDMLARLYKCDLVLVKSSGKLFNYFLPDQVKI